MPRVHVATARRRRTKRLLKRAEGFVGGRRRLFKVAAETVRRAMVYAFRDRKRRKREFHRLWITRITAAVRQRGMTYSQFMGGLARAGVGLDRKMLADIAVNDPSAFDKLVATARGHLQATV